MRPALRRTAYALGGLTVLALAAYLLRWPLFGGAVRSELVRLAGEAGADVARADIGGSLLRSLRVRDLVLSPRPGAAFVEASAADVRVSYGLFGGGRPDVRVRGLRVRLAPATEPSRPPLDAARDALRDLMALDVPARVRLVDAVVTLADGQAIEIQEASIDGREARAKVRVPIFEWVSARATFAERALSVDAAASAGPVRSVTLRLDGTDMRVEADCAGNPLSWTGRAAYDTQGRLERIEGTLVVSEGRAATKVDLVRGHVEADVDATFALREPASGDFAVRGRLAGPLLGPPEAWRIDDVRVRSSNAVARGLAIEEIDVRLGPGTAAELPAEGTVKRGPDRASLRGTLTIDRERTVSFSASVNARIEDAEPYGTALGIEGASVRDVEAKGRLVLRDGHPQFEGRLATGRGSWRGHEWRSAQFEGVASEQAVIARSLRVDYSLVADPVEAAGRVSRAGADWRIDSLAIKAGADKAQVSGRVGSDIDLRFSVEGPLAWVKRPAGLGPVAVKGRVRMSDQALEIDGSATLGDVSAEAVVIRGAREGDAWSVSLAPTTVSWGAHRVRLTEPLTGRVGANSFELTRAAIELVEPSARAVVTASGAREGEAMKVVATIGELRLEGTALADLRATFGIEGGVASGELRWGEAGGDHLMAKGSVGESWEVRLNGRLRDLTAPAVKALAPDLGLSGALSLDATLEGPRAQPRGALEIGLHAVSIAGEPPVDLTVRAQYAEGALVVPRQASRTPYGELTLEGRVPVSGEALEVLALVRVPDATVLWQRLPVDLRAWAPPGELTLQLAVRGSSRGPALHVEARAPAEYRLPEPLGPLRDMAVKATLRDGVVTIDAITGALGKGPFTASGEWRLREPARPLSVRVRGTDALAVDQRLVRLRVSPDVTVSWKEGGDVLVEGTARVPIALWYEEFGVAGGGRPGALGVRFPAAPEGGVRLEGVPELRRVRLDVRLISEGEIRIENSVIGTLASGDLRLRGSAAEPAVTGSLHATTGEVRVAQGLFVTIRQVDITIPAEPGREPWIFFEGRVGRGEGEIRVVATGPASHPDLTLQSDGLQDQHELVRRLAFGRAGGEVAGREAIGAAALKVWDTVTDSWPKAEPEEGVLSRFNLTLSGPATSSPAVPWELPPQSGTAGTILRTEYIINRWISVIAESDLENQFSGQLKLSLRFR